MPEVASCQHTWKYTDSRPSDVYRRRRRKCTKCGIRETTYEVSQAEYKLLKELPVFIAEISNKEVFI